MLPNIDFISSDLAERIGDKVATATTNGVRLTALQRMLFINKAMLQLFNSRWDALRGDKQAFATIFPELIRPMSLNTDASGKYALVTPYLDYFNLHDGYKVSDSGYISPMDRTLYSTVKASRVLDYVPDANNLAVVEYGKIFEFLPAASFNVQAVVLMYIKQPLDPATGGLLTQAGTYDSPFYPHWNVVISEMAEQLFLIAAQGK